MLKKIFGPGQEHSSEDWREVIIRSFRLEFVPEYYSMDQMEEDLGGGRGS